MKPITLIYCGSDGAAAKAFAASARNGERTILLRDAYSFDGVPEKNADVVVMPDVPRWHRDRIIAAYGMALPPDAAPGISAAEIAAPVKRRRGRPKKVANHVA